MLLFGIFSLKTSWDTMKSNIWIMNRIKFSDYI